jgi:hypothetical protein
MDGKNLIGIILSIPLFIYLIIKVQSDFLFIQPIFFYLLAFTLVFFRIREYNKKIHYRMMIITYLVAMWIVTLILHLFLYMNNILYYVLALTFTIICIFLLVCPQYINKSLKFKKKDYSGKQT